MAGARIQLKRATASSWASNNPVLYAGEIGLETDTNKFKIGDGTTAFNSLPYFNGNLTGSNLNDLADVTITDAANGDFLRWNGTAWINDAVNLSTDTIGSYVESLVAGTGVTLSNNSGEAATPTVAIGQAVGTSASVTFANVTADLVGDVTGNSSTATTLETSRIISLTGDVSGSVSFNGSSDASITATIQPNSVALGTDTTGNYVNDVTAGTGVSVTHTPGEGSSPSIAIGQAVGTSASVTFGQLTVNGQTNIGGHIIPGANETYDLGSSAARFRDIYLSGTTIDLGGVEITADGTDVSFSGGIIVSGGAALVGNLTGNADTASELQTARTIELSGDVTGSVSFDGSQNVNITTTVVNNSVALGTDTTGDYVASLVAGTGITLTNNSGESATPTVAVTTNTYDAYGAASTAASNAATALSNHESDTTNIHGIADTSILVTTTGSQTLTNKTITSPSGLVKGDVGLGNVDNTSDANKPISTATQSALDLKAPLDSPTFTGTVTLPDNTVALGTKTSGDYVASLVAGTGVTLTNNSGETATPTIAIGQAVATNSNVTFNDVTVDGNLTVNGTTTTLNTETLAVEDNIVVLNANVSGAPSSNAGIEIERGSSTNVSLRWNESSDSWEITEDGTNYRNIAAGQDVETSSSVTFAAVTAPLIGNASTASTLQNTRTISLAGDVSGAVSFDGSSNVTITTSVEPNSVALGTDTTGNYMSDLTQGTGVSITHTPGEGSNATIAIGQAVGTSSSVQFASVTAPLIGNASTATALETSRTISLSGDVSGSVSFNGTSDVSISATIQPNSVALGTDTTGNYVNDITAGTGVSVTHTPSEGSSPTIAIGQAVGTSSSVQFAAVTAPLVGNASTASTLENARTISLNGDVSGSVSFNGSSDVTITATVQPNAVALGSDTTGDYVSSLVAGTGVSLTNNTGESATPTVAIGQAVGTSASVTFAHVSAPVTGNVTGNVTGSSGSTTGNAATATALQNARIISLSGDVSGSVSFDGTSNVSISATVEPNSVALGTDTTGNYVNDLTAGTGVTVTHTPGEGSSPTIAIGQAVGTSSSVTFAHVSAPITGNVTGDLTGNVTGNVSGNAGTATALQNSRAISLGGDLSGSVSFNGTSDVTITATVQPNSVALGTDTTGNYMSDVTAGTGVTVTHTPGEASSATVAIGQAVGTSDNPSFAGVTADAVQIGISAAGEIDTTSGNLTIDSAGGTVTVDDNLIVSGDLTVNGTTTTVNTETINLADNQIVLNSNETGSPSQNAGLEIERGTSANVALRWNETSDKWELTEDGTTYVDIATVSYVDAQTINSLDEIGDVSTASAASGDFLKWNGSAWVNDPINLGSDTVGNYVSDVTAGTGVSVTHTPGEGSSPTIAIGQAVSTSSSVTFAAVTAPVIGNASTASTLQTARTIQLSGDVSGSVSFDGSADVNISATVQPNSVALGTDTTGNYMSGVTAGTGVTVTHTPGEGSDATIAIGQSVATSASPQFEALEVGNASDTTISRASAGRIAVEGVNVVTTSSTDTLTNKTLALGSNTVTGTLAQFNTAVTDADLVSLAGSETLTNKTLTSPSIGNATLTGTVTAGGSTGTSGYFLKTTGTGVEWAAAGANPTETTITTNSATTIDSFNKATADSAEFTVKITQGNRKYSTKALSLHDGSNVDLVQYGEISINEIPVTLSADISGSDVRLRATITDAATNNASVKVLKTTI